MIYSSVTITTIELIEKLHMSMKGVGRGRVRIMLNLNSSLKLKDFFCFRIYNVQTICNIASIWVHFLLLSVIKKKKCAPYARLYKEKS